MKTGYFVAHGGLVHRNNTHTNGEYIPKIHQPQRVLQVFLHKILTTGDISEGSVNMIETAYEEQKKVDYYNSHTLRIPSVRVSLDTILSETSELGKDSPLNQEEKLKRADELYKKLHQTLGEIGAENCITHRISPHHAPIQELRIDKNLIRRLQIAAGKQKILEVLSGKIIYTYTSEEVIDIVRESLGKLGVTASYIDSFIEKNSPQNSVSL